MEQDQQIRRRLEKQLEEMEYQPSEELEQPEELQDSDDNFDFLAARLTCLRNNDVQSFSEFESRLTALKEITGNNSVFSEQKVEQMKRIAAKQEFTSFKSADPVQMLQIKVIQQQSKPTAEELHLAQRAQRMYQERERMCMQREQQLSRKIEQQTHLNRFERIHFRAKLRRQSEPIMVQRIDFQVQSSYFVDFHILQNKEENRMPKNNLMLALPELARLSKTQFKQGPLFNRKLTFSALQHNVRGPSHSLPQKQPQSVEMLEAIKKRGEEIKRLNVSQKLNLPYLHTIQRGTQVEFSGKQKTVEQLMRGQDFSRWKLLDLSFQNITQIGTISMDNLQILLLQHNLIQTVSSLKFKNLVELNLCSNAIRQFDISPPPLIRYLDLSNNKITNLRFDHKLLVFMDCSFNQLNRLSLECVSLKELICRNNQLQSLQLERCVQLQVLQSSQNNLSSVNLPFFVREVQLSKNLLTSYVLQSLFLFRLNLSHNTIAQINVKDAPSLVFLDLSHNRLTSLFCQPSLNNLRQLNLSFNKLNSLVTLLDFANHCSSLQNLNYTQNEFKYCSERVHDFYSFILQKTLDRLTLLNFKQVIYSPYEAHQFSKLFRFQSSSNMKRFSSLVFRLIAFQNKRLYECTEAFRLSREYFQFKSGLTQRNIKRLNYRDNISITSLNIYHLSFVFQRKKQRALAHIHDFVLRLRKYCAKKRAYFLGHAGSLRTGLRLILRLRKQLGLNVILQAFKRNFILESSATKVKLAIANNYFRKKYMRLKSDIKKLGDRDQEDDQFDDLQSFFSKPKVIKMPKLTIPLGMLYASTLSKEVVQQAEKIVSKEVDIDHLIKSKRTKLLQNNFVGVKQSQVILEQEEDQKVPTKAVVSEHQSNPKQQKKKFIWSNNERVNQLLEARNKRNQHCKIKKPKFYG